MRGGGGREGAREGAKEGTWDGDGDCIVSGVREPLGGPTDAKGL